MGRGTQEVLPHAFEVFEGRDVLQNRDCAGDHAITIPQGCTAEKNRHRTAAIGVTDEGLRRRDCHSTTERLLQG